MKRSETEMPEKNLKPIKKAPVDLRESMGVVQPQPQPVAEKRGTRIRSSEVVIIVVVIILCLFCCLSCVGIYLLVRNIPAIWEWLTETGLEITRLLV